MQKFGRSLAAVVITGSVALAVAGCAGPGGAPGNNPEPLVGTQWLAQTIEGRQASLMPASSVKFDPGQRITGNAGCNTFSGTIGYSGDQLAVGPLATTRKMCPPEAMAQESAFLQALQSAQRFSMSEWLLTLFGPSGNQVMTLTRMTEPM